MKNFDHITQMEHIMVSQEELLQKLNTLLDELEASRQAYKALIDYYYSPQRSQDLEDDSNHLIPESMHRGVLSEDEIFDLVGDNRDTAIRMLEIGTQMLKE